MISFAFSLVLGFLALLNRRIGASWLYPPAIFAAVWSALLLGLTISGTLFFPVSEATYCVYLIGAICFSVGGFLAMLRTPPTKPTRQFRTSSTSNRVAMNAVKVGLIALVVCFPWYWSFLQDLGMAAGYNNIWIAVRARIVALSDTQWTGPVARWDSVLFSNLVTFAGLLALIGVVEGGATKRERFLVKIQVLIALVYSVLTASTAGAASLLGAILGIRSLKKGRLRLSEAMLTLAVFLVVFATIAVILGKGRIKPSAPFSDNVGPATEVVEWYTFGGLVAFDRVVQDPSSITASWSVSRFFLLTANKLGAAFDVPSLNAEYTAIASGMSTNVYTMYFSYFRDYGWLGIVFFPGVLGATLTWVYRRARDGSREAMVLYGMTFSGMVLSGFNEGFFLALNTLLKAGLVAWLLFSFPRRFRRETLATFDAAELQRARL